jgi:enoyl-CoA hydratase/carnithine racemase
VDEHERPIVVRREGSVAVLTLQRPEKLNAISTAMERALQAALGSEDVLSARAVVFAGAGRAFSAGADISEFGDRDPAAIMGYYRASGDVYERVAAMPQPTFAAIHGYCLGGGLELALATDVRIADPTAMFGLPEVGIGIVPSSGGTHRLVRLLGPARAKEMILLGRRLDAREALAAGLVAEVSEEGAALRRAVGVATAVAAAPPLAVAVAKQAIDAMVGSSRDAGLLVERLAYGMLAQTQDAIDAAARFTSKRASRPDVDGAAEE